MMRREALRLAPRRSCDPSSAGTSRTLRFRRGAMATCSPDSDASPSPTAKRKHDSQQHIQDRAYSNTSNAQDHKHDQPQKAPGAYPMAEGMRQV
eukprot:7811832-Pyramimonas_sp.AAC.1